MNKYMFGERPLQIAQYADMPFTMRQGNKFSKQVQALLDSMEPFEKGVDRIETRHFDRPILPMAVPVEPHEINWGIHKGHMARKPGYSPFVEKAVPHNLMGYITLELRTAKNGEPILVRVYGGGYTPPLPWMVSAEDAPGGRPTSLEYWHRHAYLTRNSTLIRQGTGTTRPPTWYRFALANANR